MVPLPIGISPSLTSGFLRRGKTQNVLGSLSQDAFGYHRSPVYAGVGQGGEEVMGKKLDFSTPLNHESPSSRL